MTSLATREEQATSGAQGSRRTGLALLGGGLLLLALAGGFFGYQAYIDERYEPVVSITTTPSLPTPQELQQLIEPQPNPAAPEQPATTAPLPDSGPAPSAATLAEVYALSDVAPQDWANPLWAEDRGRLAFTSEYLPVAELDLPESGLAPATLVRIPIIGLEAETITLETYETDEGGLKYESPIFDVGIIPNHTAPGEAGNTWLFGHLESPLKGEGAVFRDLPKLHDHLRNGESVYVIVDSDDGSFLYQATEFRILHKDDVHLWGSDGRTATLVCSWPRFIYDERILVTAELVGARVGRPLS